LRGLIVTLEPFHLVQRFLYQNILGETPVPITIAWAHDLEGVAAMLADQPDVGQRLMEALTPDADSPPSLRDAVKDLPPVPNPILSDAWDRFTRQLASPPTS
jgi:hypothetical protein